jgi:hypothetical protein
MTAGPCAATFTDLLFSLLNFNPSTVLHFNEVQYLTYRGLITVIWFHETVAQVTEPYVSYGFTLAKHVCG